MCVIHMAQAQAHLNNRNCTVRIGCKKKKSEKRWKVAWWCSGEKKKKKKEEGSRHLLFEGLVFDSLGKAPETSSPPLWPSIKGEAVKDCAKRIALHQRNWRKKIVVKGKHLGQIKSKLQGLPLVASDSIDSDLPVFTIDSVLDDESSGVHCFWFI